VRFSPGWPKETNDGFTEQSNRQGPRKHELTGLLQKAGAAAGAAALAPKLTVLAQEAKGANQRLGIGFIGTGGRARAHILLADPNVDVVCIATPDRLHAPQAIDALNAGKDVYCEKPLTHWAQFDLAKKVEEAAEKNGRLVQVGTQHMADENYPEIIRLIRDGIIGKPVHVTCSYFRRGDWGERMKIDDEDARPGPDLLWERFLGEPARMRPHPPAAHVQHQDGRPRAGALVDGHHLPPREQGRAVRPPERVVPAVLNRGRVRRGTSVRWMGLSCQPSADR